MRAMKVVRTQNNNDQQKFGLAYGNLYGTRIEDREISFALNDVYKIHAIYESEDDNDAEAPYPGHCKKQPSLILVVLLLVGHLVLVVVLFSLLTQL